MKDAASEAVTTSQRLPDLAALDTATLALLAETAGRELAERRKRERDAFIAEVRERSAALGFQPDELPSPFGKGSGKRAGKRTSKSPPPKYRHPHDDAQTWNGCGSAPKWLQELESQGHPRDTFRIQ